MSLTFLPTNSSQTAINLQPLLSFGILSSCLTLPQLPSSSSITTFNVSQISSLPIVKRCTFSRFTFRPSYGEHIHQLDDFLTNLTKLVSTTTMVVNSTTNSTNLLDATNTTASSNTTASVSNLNFQASLPTLPQNLPLWIGVSLVCIIVLQFLILSTHAISDLGRLLPSVLTKLKQNFDQKESSPTLLSLQSPLVVRYAVQTQRLLSPLLLISTGLLVSICLTLNSRFPTTSTSTTPTSVVLLIKSSVFSKLWLVVVFQLASWFVQRKRLREQVAFEKAKKIIEAQISTSLRHDRDEQQFHRSYSEDSGHSSIKKKMMHEEENKDDSFELQESVKFPAPSYSSDKDHRVHVLEEPLSWRLVGDSSGRLYN